MSSWYCRGSKRTVSFRSLPARLRRESGWARSLRRTPSSSSIATTSQPRKVITPSSSRKAAPWATASSRANPDSAHSPLLSFFAPNSYSSSRARPSISATNTTSCSRSASHSLRVSPFSPCNENKISPRTSAGSDSPTCACRTSVRRNEWIATPIRDCPANTVSPCRSSRQRIEWIASPSSERICP